MSFDSRPSFRLSAKNKFQKLVSSNRSSSFRERLISNETYEALSDKSRNLTRTVLDKTGLDAVINKTKSFLPSNPFSNQNVNSSKGFFDALFSPQTVDDFYLKVAIICLWIVATFCVIATIVTMFVSIRSKNKNKKNSTTRWVFFHIFLCELCYLIYILLSMINVGLNFRLNSFWCDIGKYFMYATVPVMYLVLVILFFERIATYCGINTSAVGKLNSAVFIQILIGIIWIVSIILISIFIYLKNRAKNSIRSLPDKILPEKFKFPWQEILLPDQCSIDGQLLPIFKILFLVLLIIIIILFLKSMVFSIVYAVIPSMFARQKASNNKNNDNHMTLIFIIIIFFNLTLSFPFYFISTANSIVDAFRGDQSFTMKLKISFILRLVSIILQCFIFYILENGCWNVLQKIIGFILCQKGNQRRENTDNGKRRADKPRSALGSSEEEAPLNVNIEASRQQAGDDNGNVSTDEEVENGGNSRNTAGPSPATRQFEETESDEMEEKEDDVPKKSLFKQTSSTKEKTVTNSKATETKNSSKKTTSNGTVTPAPKPATTVDQKPSKSTKIEKNPKPEPVSISSLSSDDDDVFIVDETSNKKNQPTIVQSSPPPLPGPSIHRMHSLNRHRGHRRHWTTKGRFSRSIPTTSTNPKYIKLSPNETKSAEPTNNHVKKQFTLTRLNSTPV